MKKKDEKKNGNQKIESSPSVKREMIKTTEPAQPKAKPTRMGFHGADDEKELNPEE
jgi:hypothetical protein